MTTKHGARAPWWIGSASGSAKIVDIKSGTGSDPFFRRPFEL